MREEWTQITLDSPRLLVGWRTGNRHLNAHRVPLHEDVFQELAEMCRPAVAQLRSYDERPYEPFAALDDAEYFWQPHDELRRLAAPIAQVPSRSGAAESNEEDAPSDDMTDVGDLVGLVRAVDGLDSITKDDIDEGGYTFYAICWPYFDTMIGFVSRANPSSTLRPGLRFFRYGNQMRHVDRPDFALRDGAELVVGHEGTAVLSPYSFATLFGDVGVDFERVDADVASVKRRLRSKLPLTPAAESALAQEGRRTRGAAKRLRHLPERVSSITLNPDLVRQRLGVHGVNPGEVLNNQDEFSFGPQNVGVFLDLIEGRYFEDDFGSERRRADRFSTR